MIPRQQSISYLQKQEQVQKKTDGWKSQKEDPNFDLNSNSKHESLNSSNANKVDLIKIKEKKYGACW